MNRCSRNFRFLQMLITFLFLLLTGCGDNIATPVPPTATTLSTPQNTAQVVQTRTATPVLQTSAATAIASQAAGTEIKKGGTLRVAFNTEVLGLDPAGNVNGPSLQLFNSLYDSLVSVDPNARIIPALAQSWTVSSDGKSYTFRLRQDVKFQDGSDFGAEAVKFNIERYKAGQNAQPKTALAGIELVEVPDPFTIVLHLKNPDAAFLANMALSVKMVSPTAVQKQGVELARNPSGAGTGPFKFVEWKKDERLVVERNPNYWKKDAVGNPLPYLDKIIYRPIPDDISRAINLKTGDIEVVNALPPQQAEELRNDKDLAVRQVPSTGLGSIFFNTTTEPFNNKALRQAVAYALDRAELVRVVFQEKGIVAEGILTPAIWAYDPQFKFFGYDKNQAKAKLIEAGKSGGFSFKLQVVSQAADRQIAEIMRDQLLDVGIKVEIEQMELAAQLQNRTEKKYSAQFVTGAGSIDPDGLMYPFYKSNGDRNYFGYSQPQVDALLEKGRAVSELKERTQIYQEAQKLIMNDAPIIPLYVSQLYVLAGKKVQNYSLSADLQMRFGEVWLSQG